VRDGLQAKFGDASEAKLQWRPLNTTMVDGEAAESLMKFIDALEDNDDVQNVFGNYEVSEETLQRLTA
ncbi:MAG TPA: YebC/PmpR family DNA-binding transcriptional regulator, partial [Dongiaceae bacterium]